MQRLRLIMTGLGVLFLVVGCASTRTTASLENRVQILESRIQSLEGQTGESPDTDVSSYGIMPETAVSVSADSLTKKQIQMALRNAGYYDGAVDGKVGPKTTSAIKKFQADMGLKADGIAGKKTKEKLVKYLP
ncbi:MAG: peptidoglycan-binding domain-containing protein [Candidatus Omnitrophota bacterium]